MNIILIEYNILIVCGDDTTYKIYTDTDASYFVVVFSLYLYIVAMVGPYPDALDYWGAKNAAKILDDNEWWRYFTPLFLHG